MLHEEFSDNHTINVLLECVDKNPDIQRSRLIEIIRNLPIGDEVKDEECELLIPKEKNKENESILENSFEIMYLSYSLSVYYKEKEKEDAKIVAQITLERADQRTLQQACPAIEQTFKEKTSAATIDATNPLFEPFHLFWDSSYRLFRRYVILSGNKKINSQLATKDPS